MFCFSSEKIEKGQKITFGTMQNGRGAFLIMQRTYRSPKKTIVIFSELSQEEGVG